MSIGDVPFVIPVQPEVPETNWREIACLYDELARTGANPVYELNRIVALSYVEGPAAALARLEPIAMALLQYQPFHAVQADLLLRLGETGAAAAAYRRAIDLSHSAAEKLFLSGRLEALGAALLATKLPRLRQEDLGSKDGEDARNRVVEPAQHLPVRLQP